MLEQIRKLDEHHAAHVARMHGHQAVMREDFARSHAFELRMRAAGRQRVVNGERRFQAEIAQQIVGIHDALATAANRYAALRAEFVEYALVAA